MRTAMYSLLVTLPSPSASIVAKTFSALAAASSATITPSPFSSMTENRRIMLGSRP
ncbi:hypothetical protein [Breoghania sp.]|uniref:hypothetical protein n=1 Tax=Breoghania sp. TaxID=2065378 RepID=UPI00260D6F62|nr:hypothetical protein [Breoghania sp.]MDJ0931769.1 hypothetical protein [Breoghania sp.]